ncbi:MAG: hypothetical protein GY826_03620, partial [Fuerstiella sp.]|nr:hypothetical protein [Fuerstiella sp.]
FRNEPLPVDDSLSVRREQELNDRLRERDVSVYLTEDNEPNIDSEPEFDLPELMSRMRSREPVAPQPIGLSTPDPDARSKTDTTDGTSDRLLFAPPQVAVTEHSATTADSSGANKSPPSMADILGNADSAKSHAAASSPEFIEYTVQLGDTLSEISERFLGSQSRYREVYEAN